ncbi:MAG: hypothetical protein V7756_18265 [Halopseudomonas sp.]
MAEGVGKGDAPGPAPLHAFTFLLRACLDGALRRISKTLYNKVEMRWRPVPRVLAGI